MAYQWFLKKENVKYCAGSAVATPFKVINVAPLPLATSAQQAELHALTWACISAKGKTADNRYAFGVAHDLLLWKQQGLFISNGTKIQNGSYVQHLLDATLLPATLAVIKVPGHSKLDSLEAKGNHIADISAKNVALKGTKNQTSVMSKGMLPQIIT